MVVAGPRAQVDVLDPVGGVPLVARAVRGLLGSGVVHRVVVLDERAAAAERACAGLPVDVRHPGAVVPVTAHTGQRATGARGSADVVLVHDAARPLAPAALAAAVVEAVLAGHDAAVPVLPASDTFKRVDADGAVVGTPDRAGLRLVQTPQALRRELLDAPGVDPLDAALAHAAAGARVTTVPGHPLATAVRTPWDLELLAAALRRASEEGT